MPMPKSSILLIIPLFALLLITGAYASTMMVHQTTTVSAVYTLPDGSPGGLTTTVRNVLTWNSTSTAISSSSLGHREMIENLYGSSSCPTIPNSAIPTMIIRWDSTPIVNGLDKWQLVFVGADRPGNSTLVMRVTSDNGNHTVVATEYHGSQIISNHSSILTLNSTLLPYMNNTQAPNHTDFGLNEFTDFYFDGDGVNFFWYGPHAGFIATFAALNAPSLNITSMAAYFAPLTFGQKLTFQPSFTLGYFLMGQDLPANGLSSLQSGYNSPCNTPLANSMENIQQANMCEGTNSIGLDAFIEP